MRRVSRSHAWREFMDPGTSAASVGHARHGRGDVHYQTVITWPLCTPSTLRWKANAARCALTGSNPGK